MKHLTKEEIEAWKGQVRECHVLMHSQARHFLHEHMYQTEYRNNLQEERDIVLLTSLSHLEHDRHSIKEKSF